MLYLIFLGAVFCLVYLPQLWVQHMFNSNSTDHEDISGTGGQLAEYLIGELKLPGISIEKTDLGDHFDPLSQTVRLNNRFYDSKSLAAVAIAAHEVGHAVQYCQNNRMLKMRTDLARYTAGIQKACVIVLMIVPIFGLLLKSSQISFIMIGFSVFTMILSIILHMITLPVEFDASFGKALPLLTKGQFLDRAQLSIVRRILLAASLTYVASALAQLLDITRWLRLLKR